MNGTLYDVLHVLFKRQRILGLAFLFIFLLTRIVGRRELGAMEPFDLIMLIVLGDLVQQGVTQSDYSVTGLVLAGGTLALMQVAASYLSFRFRKLRPVTSDEIRDREMCQHDSAAQLRGHGLDLRRCLVADVDHGSADDAGGA